MIKKIKAYKSSDGCLFESETQANEYENRVNMSENLSDFFDEYLYDANSDLFAEIMIENKEEIIEMLKQQDIRFKY